ncbi:hypothetical protein C8N46_105333 [Kordia periserrulae]|uniref:Uncharacterized protein n=1 Tax=Kordia periserrulae TaxID=701523 RepID=A0A2T6BYQ8_9FLAO|nr:hypothetical protein [Kordia periserrulae]PTX61176.1 hypothetical protein C8N46_105333 [Kordia periserrulae]
MLKTISNLQGVKKLSKQEQNFINGGNLQGIDITSPKFLFCSNYAGAMALSDGTDGGYLDDEVTMSTLYREHFNDCYFFE